MTLPLSRAPQRSTPSHPLSIPAAVRSVIRPVWRIRTVATCLVLAIVCLVLVGLTTSNEAANALLASSLAQLPAAVQPVPPAVPSIELEPEVEEPPPPPLDRSFEEPDFSLLSGKQPHEIGCDVSLEGPDAGPLVFVGIFSTAARKGRRDLYRKHILPDFPDNLITTKFIIGMPPYDVEEPDPENPENPENPETTTTTTKKKKKKGKSREVVLEELIREMNEHNDIVLLDIIDNIDFGKTHEYYKWLAKEYAGDGPLKGRPRFVMKADDDTVFVMPNLISNFRDLDCAQNIYWGTSAGRSGHFNDYFRGLAYALSWPLVSWIGSANMPEPHTVKIEDARTGQWLRALDPATDPVQRIDLGWMMGDWNQLDITVNTVAFHWLKLDEWVPEIHDRVKGVWNEAGRPYGEQNGVERRISVAMGKSRPKKAEEEHQRQKELGWDVGNNF